MKDLNLEQARAKLREIRAKHKAEAKPWVDLVNRLFMQSTRKGKRISADHAACIKEGMLYTNDPKLLAAGALPLERSANGASQYDPANPDAPSPYGVDEFDRPYWPE